MKQSFAWLAASVISLFGCTLCAAEEPGREGVEFFEKNIRPVLADNCYKCHSASAAKVKGKFFADSLEGLKKGGGSEKPGIVPGNPEKSELIKSIRYRYEGEDDSLNMPPKNKKDGTGGKLDEKVIKNLEEWVKMGAPAPKDFEKPAEKKTDAGSPPESHPSLATDTKAHWAFQQPKLPTAPVVKDTRWGKNEIDGFVLAKLEAKGLHPSLEADRRTLIRRATFDLIGLPPTPEEVDAFIADRSADAYAKVVERLLADPRYGERWARHWLDIARYSDTKGYVFQEERRYPYAYTYRDYVIRAFNDDKPYDRFLIEQIAADQLDLKGDLRPLAAMGFLTLGRRFLNNIHDIIDDRIDVVCRGTMALTVGCARCHDHKFDPIPTKDYYGLHGIFASSTEPKDLPLLSDASADTSPGAVAFRTELAKRQSAVDQYRDSRSAEILSAMRTAKGLSDYLLGVAAQSGGKDVGGESATDLSRYMLARWKTYLAQQGQKKDAVFAAWRMYAALPPAEFEAKAAGSTEKWTNPDAKGKPAVVNSIIADSFASKPPKNLKDVADRYGELLSKFDKPDKLENPDEEALRLTLRGPDVPLAVPPAELTRLFKRDSNDALRNLQNKVDEWQATSPDAPARAMVLNDAPNPHDSNVLLRGNPGNPGPPAPRKFLSCVSNDGKPFTKGSGRLEFATAIASKDNPLTARVLVNRVWGWHFGKPIVRTPSDFGVRSDPPTHPELLDYLAVTFMNDGWSIKALHRRIMLSATYRQASDDVAQARAVDSENTLLWRQNRTRLDFEETRDSLLAVSGVLDKTMFGKPVDADKPEAARRTIYSFIDRQNLPSVFRSFDFASPDMHAPQRFQTTVPQQALFFMNSPFTQTQAKVILARADIQSQKDVSAKATRLYQVLFNRKPSADELALAQTFIDAETGAAAEPTPTAPKPVWLYGYGKVDADGKKISFTALPYKGRDGWRGGKKLPDPTLGFVSLTAGGGHPGSAYAAIRRWTAPASGTLTISGTLNHAQDAGDGVTGKIVSSRTGVLGEWHVRNSKADASVKGVTVEAGDTIDFIVEAGPTDTSDGFSWAPTLRLENPKIAGGYQQFDAARDFAGTGNEVPAPLVKLSAWEKYAQVLMMSDEFVFVD